MDVFKATKKPVTIEVIKFVEVSRTKRRFGYSVEYNLTEIARFIGKPLRSPTRVNGTKEGERVVIIETLEGNMTAHVGDYIIKGVNGEFYPCKPDIFTKTYDF